MDDDFDNGMGMPDEELPGGSALSDTGDVGAGDEGDADAELSESSGRMSGGARARKPSSAGKSAAAPASAKRGSGGGARTAARATHGSQQ